MPQRLPEIIEIDRVGADGAVYSGEILLSRLPRIRNVMVEARGTGKIELGLRRESQSCLVLSGMISATVLLECQRCLDPFECCLGTQVDCDIIRPMDEERRARDAYTVDQDGILNVYELIEGELLLQLPVVPKHKEPRHCNQAMLQRAVEYVPGKEGSEQGYPRQHPFAVLKDLKN